VIRIVLVGKRKQPLAWSAIYLNRKYKLARWRMLDGVQKIVHLIYGPGRYYDYPWEKRFNVYNALYRHDHEVWVKYLERRLSKLNRGLVVDDPHYVNELEYLRDKLGFIIIRVTMENKLKPAIGRALLDSEPGTVLLQEWYGHYVGADGHVFLKVDYSITVSDTQGLYRALDEVMEKINAKNSSREESTETSQ
jgi:hypothetical protein